MATYSTIASGSPLLNYSQPAATVTPSSNGNDFLASILPNYNQNKSKVGGIIENLLNGNLSPEALNAIKDQSAAWGVSNGQSGSGIQGNRSLRDLGLSTIGQQQTGIQDLLAYLSGASNPALASQGQANQVGEFNAGQQQQQGEFNTGLAFQNMMQQLKNPSSSTNYNPSGLNDGTYFTPAGGSGYTRI